LDVPQDLTWLVAILLVIVLYALWRTMR